MNTPRPADQDILTLAGDFAAADPDAWLAVAEKSLGGRPYEKLTASSYDGLTLKPLYTESSSGGEDIGFPGFMPHTRGGSALGSAITGWDVRCLSSHPYPAEANRQILADLEKGATSIWLKLDPSGRSGTVIKCRADMEILLGGVYLDLAPVVLNPGGPSLPPAAYLMDVLDKKGVQPTSFTGNFGADPLSTLAAVGKVIVPMETLLGRMADLTVYVSRTYPNAKALNIATTVYHNAGCSEAQELAVAMATAVEYMRHVTAAGLSVEEACQQTAFTLTCDADVFLTVAKLRVARRLWARVTEICGALESSRNAPIHAITAPRMMSRRDPWVNILRGTVACFAAGIGGADSITVLPFENAIGLPTDLGRRIARNTQHILQEESSINRVVDPAGGSWLIESITADLAEKSWSLFQEIEASGGMARALSNGSLADRIAETEVKRAHNIATRKDALTGVSEFPDIAETPVRVDRPDTQTIIASADERSTHATGEVGALPSHGAGVLTAALVVAARGDASIATIGAALKGTPTEITPLTQHRLAEDYETLRDASDRWTADHGQRPRVFLANIGRVADFTARATFAKSLFEAGGIEIVAGDGGDGVADIVTDFADSGASAAVLCSTDSIYVDVAIDLAQALQAAGAEIVFMAGRAGDRETALREAGVDDFIYIGCDVLDVLNNTQAQLGVTS